MSVNCKFVLFCWNFQFVNALILIVYLFGSESSHNLECEDLWVYYIKLLQKNLNRLSLSRVWPSVSRGVHKYPYNPKSYSAMLTLSYLYSVSNNLRLTLDKCSQRWNFHLFFHINSLHIWVPSSFPNAYCSLSFFLFFEETSFFLFTIYYLPHISTFRKFFFRKQ